MESLARMGEPRLRSGNPDSERRMRRPGRGGNRVGAHCVPESSVWTTADPAMNLAGCVGNAARRVREQTAENVPEEEERDDDGDCEEAEQDCVLGRRLAILTLPQLMHPNLQCNHRTHQDVGHLEVPPPVRGATQPLHVTDCPSD